MDPGLAGDVHHPFADLAGDVGVEALGDRDVELPLGAAADDSEALDRVGTGVEHQWIVIVDLGASLAQLGGGEGLRETPPVPDRQTLVGSEGLAVDEPEGFRRQSVVAIHRVAVERQVVGEEIDLAGDQLPHPSVLHPGQDQWGTVPEDAVVDQDRVGIELAGADEEILAGRDPGDQPADSRPAFDLEAVGAVVLTLADRQQLSQVGDKLFARHGNSRHRSIPSRSAGRRSPATGPSAAAGPTRTRADSARRHRRSPGRSAGCGRSGSAAPPPRGLRHAYRDARW